MRYLLTTLLLAACSSAETLPVTVSIDAAGTTSEALKCPSAKVTADAGHWLAECEAGSVTLDLATVAGAAGPRQVVTAVTLSNPLRLLMGRDWFTRPPSCPEGEALVSGRDMARTAGTTGPAADGQDLPASAWNHETGRPKAGTLRLVSLDPCGTVTLTVGGPS